MRALTLGTAAATAMVLLAGCGKDKDDEVVVNTTATQVVAPNPNAPAPGLWQVTQSVAGQTTPAVELCMGATAEGTNAFLPSNSGNCTGAAPVKTATGWEFTSQCTAPDGSTSTIKGTVSGDLTTSFKSSLMVNAGGKDVGMETTYIRVGDCPAGATPAPVTQ